MFKQIILIVYDTETQDYALIITLMMIGVSLISFWVGAQRSAEELYIQDSNDKEYAEQ